jgi:hypothetical protein
VSHPSNPIGKVDSKNETRRATEFLIRSLAGSMLADGFRVRLSGR